MPPTFDPSDADGPVTAIADPQFWLTPIPIPMKIPLAGKTAGGVGVALDAPNAHQ
jgi:hypothetical protein